MLWTRLECRPHDPTARWKGRAMPRLRPFAALGLILASCPGPAQKAAPNQPPTAGGPGSDALHTVTTDELGLTFRLSEGVEGAGERHVTPPAKTTPLTDADTKKVLDRLPPMTALAVEKAFAMRERSLPPPKTGDTVKAAFPPPEAPRAPS